MWRHSNHIHMQLFHICCIFFYFLCKKVILPTRSPRKICISFDQRSYFVSSLLYTSMFSSEYTFLAVFASARFQRVKHGRPQAWARGGTCSPHPPCWKCCKVFLCISSYSKTLNRQIIYALFSLPVSTSVSKAPRPSPGLHPWTLLGDFRPQTPNLPTPGKNPAGAYVAESCLLCQSITLA